MPAHATAVTTNFVFSPEYGGNVKNCTYGEDEEADGHNDDEQDKLPCVTRSHVTHSLDRRTAYVTRTCAHVTDTATVAIFLDSQQNLLTLRRS